MDACAIHDVWTLGLRSRRALSSRTREKRARWQSLPGLVPEPKKAPGHRPETLKITGHNVAAIAASGRARWKIESQKNHTLKTKGDHLKPNFGHGKNGA